MGQELLEEQQLSNGGLQVIHLGLREACQHHIRNLKAIMTYLIEAAYMPHKLVKGTACGEGDTPQNWAADRQLVAESITRRMVLQAPQSLSHIQGCLRVEHL